MKSLFIIFILLFGKEVHRGGPCFGVTLLFVYSLHTFIRQSSAYVTSIPFVRLYRESCMYCTGNYPGCQGFFLRGFHAREKPLVPMVTGNRMVLELLKRDDRVVNFFSYFGEITAWFIRHSRLGGLSGGNAQEPWSMLSNLNA